MSGLGIARFADDVAGRATLPSAVLEYAARQRSLEVSRSSLSMLLVRIGAVLLPFVDLNGPDSSAVGKDIGACRDCVLHLLDDEGIAVPRYSTFTEHQLDRALMFAEELGWPVMIGPARRPERGGLRWVRDESGFRAAWRRSVGAYSERAAARLVVVTEYTHGETLQVAVVDEEAVAVTRFVPATVDGDGRTAIGDLIAQKNAVRARNPYVRDLPIPDDPSELDALGGRALTDIAAEGERVALRSPATLTGADVVDVTDGVGPDLKRLAVDAVTSIPGLSYGGAEIVTPGTFAEQGRTAPGRPVVVNVGWSPPLSGRFPTHGAGRDVAGAVLDHYVHRPRWLTAQRKSHQLGPGSGTAPMWLG